MDRDLKEILKQINCSLIDRKLIRSYKMVEFLKSYTLHDSYINLLFGDDQNYFTIGIKWDIFWNKEKLNISDIKINVDTWPIIFISFPILYKVNWTMYQGDICDTILETQSEILELSNIDDSLRKVLSNNKENSKLVKTRFNCLYGDIELIHEDPVEFICVDDNGNVVAMELE